MIIGVVLVGSVFGFLVGLFAFRVKSRWCPVCGNDTDELANQTRRRVARPPAD